MLGEFTSWKKENSLKGKKNSALGCLSWARNVRHTVTRESFTNEVQEGLNVQKETLLYIRKEMKNTPYIRSTFVLMTDLEKFYL